MTDDNDRKDENQLRKGVGRGFAEPLLWALALFVSAMIPFWPLQEGGQWPPFIGRYLGLIVAVPAAIIGYILAGGFGAPSWPKRAFLVVLCVGVWGLGYIYYKL